MKPPAALESLAAGLRGALEAAVRTHGRVVYACSLGAEAMVLTDIIFRYVPAIEVFSIDTGRLHEETHALLERIEHRYGRRIKLMHPSTPALESLTGAQGFNGFYQSLAARQECCQVRKLEPFRRGIAGFCAWVTGVRREQSPARARMQPSEWDSSHGLYKLSPLLEWTHADVWQHIRAHNLPYNPLHDAHFPSIGCAPCTRAVQPGEHSRAGRWWWEQSESRECGLHPSHPAHPRHALAEPERSGPP